MSDKFVVSTNEIGRIIVTDVETGNVYHHDNLSHFLGLIRLLNEQQSTISQLEGKVKRLNAFIVSKDLAIEYLKWNKKGES